MGKTAFATQMLTHFAEKNLSVALFSLEMSAEQIMERVISNVGRVDLNVLKAGEMEDKDWAIRS